MLANRVFDNFILTGESLADVYRIFATCLLFNYNLCGKLVSSSELSTIFDDYLKTTSVSFFIVDYNL